MGAAKQLVLVVSDVHIYTALGSLFLLLFFLRKCRGGNSKSKSKSTSASPAAETAQPASPHKTKKSRKNKSSRENVNPEAFSAHNRSPLTKRKHYRPSVYKMNDDVAKLLVSKNIDQMSGFLKKKSSAIISQWQMRWFEITGTYLNYYKTDQRKKLLAAIDLRCLVSVELGDDDRVFSLDVADEQDPNSSNRHHYELKAQSKDDRNRWVERLRLLNNIFEEGEHAATSSQKEEKEKKRKAFIKDAEFDNLAKLASFENDGTWKEIYRVRRSDTDHLQILRRKVEGHETVFEYMTRGVAPFHMDKFWGGVVDLEYHKQWDTFCQRLDVVHEDWIDKQNSDLESIIFWKVKFPLYMPSRDYLYYRRIKTVMNAEGKPVKMAVARVSNTFPTIKKLPEEFSKPPKGSVRVDLYTSHSLLRENPDDPTGQSCSFVMKCVDDPKVALPKMILNWLVENGLPKFMVNFYKACVNYPTT
mmetsp:Transcript_50589/g.99086  ORF Transcript_50589/g.99086 Transcript_50589/m.99086 type:complete len:472 (+) Transcript_50589:63-1478(+)|eukprot:CAMPEP_0175150184 /NCGR_PEP_ID=MMETSP0087-20121206/17714_1 /TAXON_ID=136419 /ORGANISM="Unknown Unknown, Strain D1" /LENGTH=471 /DNA_ID=CAMNT_0016436071 /DNA_START=26 /DNA_END=1441 /DNA_ORIENTATION=+